jgi:hypothetical protein
LRNQGRALALSNYHKRREKVKVYPKNLQSVFEAHQFTWNWRENDILKNLCKKYKGDEFMVNETKQRVTFGDYVLVSGSTVLVVSEQFFKENFSDVELMITVAMTEEHEAVAVSLQDDEHRMHEIVWECSEFEKRVEAEAETEESGEENITLQIKQYFRLNEVKAILNDSDLLLEKRIEKIKMLIVESDPDAAKLAIEYIKAELDIDLVPNPHREDRHPKSHARVEAPKHGNSHRHKPNKGSERGHRENRIQFVVNTKIAYPC